MMSLGRIELDRDRPNGGDLHLLRATFVDPQINRTALVGPIEKRGDAFLEASDGTPRFVAGVALREVSLECEVRAVAGDQSAKLSRGVNTRERLPRGRLFDLIASQIGFRIELVMGAFHHAAPLTLARSRSQPSICASRQ